MPQNMENIMHYSNSNDEIRKLCTKNNDLETELKKSLNQSKDLIEDVFIEMSLKGKFFRPLLRNKLILATICLYVSLIKTYYHYHCEPILQNQNIQTFMNFILSTLLAELIILIFLNVLSTSVLGMNHPDV